MHNFHKEIDNLFSSNNYPIIVVCISNKKDIHIDLKRRFLAVFNVEIPTQEQRLQMLKWLVELKNLEVEGELESIANKSYGFCYEDLEALIFYARSYSYGESKDTSKMKLEETYLAKALGELFVERLYYLRSHLILIVDIHHESLHYGRIRHALND